MTALRSSKYLAGSRDAPCTFQIPDVCTGNGVVPCHIHDRHKGGGNRASDLSVGDGCFDCHAVFDRRAKLPSGRYITADEQNFYGLRALQDTLERRREIGLLFVPEDAVTERRVKPRKPPSQRRAVGKSPPLKSRPFRKGERPMRSPKSEQTP